jgi:lipoprotein-releasing system permease protein
MASTLGALAPLLGLAAVEGTIRQVQQRITGIGSYIDVSERKQGNVPTTCDSGKVISLISAAPHVTSVAPYLNDQAIIETTEDSRAVAVKAIDPDSEARTTRLGAYVTPHDALDRLGSKEVPVTPILVGISVANALDLKTGETVALSHPSGNILGSPPMLLDGVVVGFLHTGLGTDGSIIIPIDNMAALANVPHGCVTGFSVLTDDMATSGSVARKLDAILGDKFHATNWTERFPLYNQTILLLSLLTKLLTTVIVTIAMGAITAIAMLVSYSKRRDFATLFALGLSIRQIRLAHVFLALTIGFLGFALAAASAPLICHYCNYYEVIKVPGSLDNAFVSFTLLGKHFLFVSGIEMCCLISLGLALPRDLRTSSLTRILRDE